MDCQESVWSSMFSRISRQVFAQAQARGHLATPTHASAVERANRLLGHLSSSLSGRVVHCSSFSTSADQSGSKSEADGASLKNRGVFGVAIAVHCQGKDSSTAATYVSPTTGDGVSKPGSWTRRKNCGEDAFFVARKEGVVALGVADGVGGWRSSGVDPSLFSWALMRHAHDASAELPMLDRQWPQNVLEIAFRRLKASNEVKAGSSTASIIGIDTNRGILCSANLGDSGYIVIRNGQVVAKGEQQQHYFNCPFQLQVVPPYMRTGVEDLPKDAAVQEVILEHMDVIVMASDGLFDNVSEKQIVEVVQKEVKDGSSETHQECAAISSVLLQQGVKNGKDVHFYSPFAQEYNRANPGARVTGGKEDDVTVVVAKVVQSAS